MMIVVTKSWRRLTRIPPSVQFDKWPLFKRTIPFPCNVCNALYTDSELGEPIHQCIDYPTLHNRIILLPVRKIAIHMPCEWQASRLAIFHLFPPLLLINVDLQENPAISDRLKMILKNPRLLDLMSIIIFSTAFFIYVFDYWVITNHDNDYDY